MAADLSERIGRAVGQVEACWSPERAAAVLHAVHQNRRRQKRRRGLGAAVAVLVLAGLSARQLATLRAPRASVASLGSAPKGMPPNETPAPAELQPLHLRDGSVARPQGKASQVRVREDRPGRTVVELAGAAQFEVVHDPLRLFRVETRGLAVEVLGTRFFIEEQGPRVRVTVQQGRVRVLWASHYDELAAGQSALFLPEQPPAAGDKRAAASEAVLPPLNEPAPASSLPPGPALPEPPSAHSAPARLGTRRGTVRSEPPAPPPAATATVPPIPTLAPTPAPTPAPEVVAAPAELGPASWQTLAHEGQFEQAYRVAYGRPVAPHPAEPPLLRERQLAPGELLLLADVARLSHHPADAVAPLSRLLREQAQDPRAPLAAFTLGRVLLDELGRPREAAQSFARVQQLDPEGPLAQDALAREVEAWSRAGESASAHACAVQYVQKYPEGRRLRSVRHFGELW